MAARHYLAVIERAAEGYGVFFPDLPGCTSGGATLEEAAVNAEEALRGHVEIAVEEGQTLPAPSGLDDVQVDPDVDEAARLLVRVDMPGAAVRVNITVPDDVLASVDRHVEQQGFTRSGFFVQAAQEKMRRERSPYVMGPTVAGVGIPLRADPAVGDGGLVDAAAIAKLIISEIGFRRPDLKANAPKRARTTAATRKR
jgi:predicted RNase H-like HicB family nuclease